MEGQQFQSTNVIDLPQSLLSKSFIGKSAFLAQLSAAQIRRERIEELLAFHWPTVWTMTCGDRTYFGAVAWQIDDNFTHHSSRWQHMTFSSIYIQYKHHWFSVDTNGDTPALRSEELNETWNQAKIYDWIETEPSSHIHHASKIFSKLTPTVLNSSICTKKPVDKIYYFHEYCMNAMKFTLLKL